MSELLGGGFDGNEWPHMSFTKARGLYLERVESLPVSQLDMFHLDIANAVLHMAYTPDGTLVQEILEPDGSDSGLGYARIDPEDEAGLTFVLMSTLRALDDQPPSSGQI
jgi:hypothetical protein